MRLRRIRRVERVQRDIAQQHQAIALLHARWTRPVRAAAIGARVQRTRLRIFAADVAEVVVGQGAAQLMVAIDLPRRAHLRTEQPFVFAGHFCLAAARRIVGRILERNQAQGTEHGDVLALAERFLQLGGDAVKIEFAGKQFVARHERVIEAARSQFQPGSGLVREPGLVQPDVFLAQATTQGLRGGHGAVIIAAGQADARLRAVGNVGQDAQAGTRAQQVLAVFTRVQQRRQSQVGVRIDVVAAAAVERAPVDLDIAVGHVVVARFVARAHVAFHADALGPGRCFIRRRPAARFCLGHDLALDFVADLLAHGV